MAMRTWVADRRAAVRPPPAPGLLLLAMVLFQIGSTVAKDMFSAVGPDATVFMRLTFGAAALLLVWRPRLRGHTRQEYGLIGLYGLLLVVMYLAFFAALARLPLGVAVTVEFVGPLGVAVAGSRRRLDLLWAAFAAAGILLLAPVGAGRVDPLGLALALLAGSAWAAYIPVAARLGRSFSGGTGVALAMTVSAVALIPVGVSAAGAVMRAPWVIVTGAAVGLLSTALPFSLELEALRRMPARVYGIMVSGEPVIAALAGFVVLHESLGVRAVCAVVLVTAASLGSARTRGQGERPTAAGKSGFT